MKMLPVLALAMLLLVCSGIGLADDDSVLKRCRGIRDAAARLACYDTIPLPRAEGLPTTAAPSAAPAPKESPSALLERFGLEGRAPSAQPDRLESHIPGRFEGWQAKSKIRLANGQVWQVVDDTWLAGEWVNPRVSVRRGMMGSFYLDIEGESRSPRVRRVQ